MKYRSAAFSTSSTVARYLKEGERGLLIASAFSFAALTSSACSSGGDGQSGPLASGGAGLAGSSSSGGAAGLSSGGASPSGLGGSSGSSAGGAFAGGASSAGGSDSASRGGATGAGGSPGSGGTNGSSGAASGGNGSAGAAGASASGGKSSDGGSGGRDASGGVAGNSAGNAGSGGGNSGSGGAASQMCSASQKPPSAGNQRVTLQFGGQSRSYILHVPKSLGTEPLAVVFDFHGASGSASGQQSSSGWDAVADREHFLTVYPDGVGGYWNVDDTCCGVAGSQKVDDVGFAKAIVTRLSSEMCIDRKRIYASGFSNGGGLAHRLGCQAADVFAAIGPTATDLRTKPCTPSRPISMIEFRGLNDDLEPYAGGIVGPVGGQYTSPGAKGSLKLWADINECKGTPVSSGNYCESYTDCAAGVEVALCSLPNTGHDPYHNGPNFDVASAAWKLFASHPMK